MLTKAQIRKLIDLTQEETVVEPSEGFPFRISRRGFGYSRDPDLGPIQAALSIMLQAARD